MVEELRKLESLLFKGNNLEIINVVQEDECKDYYGFNFQCKNLKIKFRKAKITPKKTGQFVTLWKRNCQKQTEPFDIKDDFDFYIIACQQNNNFGFFIFPKHVLAKKHILTDNDNLGKRGFRIYSSWDVPRNQQAQKSKTWQCKYFIDMTGDVNQNLGKLVYLLAPISGPPTL